MYASPNLTTVTHCTVLFLSVNPPCVVTCLVVTWFVAPGNAKYRVLGYVCLNGGHLVPDLYHPYRKSKMAAVKPEVVIAWDLPRLGLELGLTVMFTP